MNYINDLDELNEKLDTLPEPIVYPMRREGEIFMDYCRYNFKPYLKDGVWGKFWCIAKESWPNYWAFSQRTIREMPVILLKNLPHFRETGNFFVAVPGENVDHVVGVLKDFGFQNVWLIREKVFYQMKEKLDELMKIGFITNYHINYFNYRITQLEFRIEEQLEVRDTNIKAFAEYRNAFRGKKIVIVAGGPTVNYYKPIEDAIHIGINLAWKKTDVNFDFLFSHDRSVTEGFEKNEDLFAEKVKGFAKVKERAFVNKRLGRMPEMEASVCPEDISIKYPKVARYYSNTFNMGQHLYQDICYHPTADFYNTVFSALHFALFTYPKEIYLVGCDVTDTGHFYDTKSESGIFIGPIKVGYARMKVLAEQWYPETEIISINPVTLKDLFPAIYTDEYRKSLETE